MAVNNTSITCYNSGQCEYPTTSVIAVVNVTVIFQSLLVANVTINLSTAVQNGTHGVIKITVLSVTEFLVVCNATYTIWPSNVSNVSCNTP